MIAFLDDLTAKTLQSFCVKVLEHNASAMRSSMAYNTANAHFMPLCDMQIAVQQAGRRQLYGVPNALSNHRLKQSSVSMARICKGRRLTQHECPCAAAKRKI